MVSQAADDLEFSFSSWPWNETAILAAIEWCLEPLPDLPEEKRDRLARSFRVALDWHAMPTAIDKHYGGRKETLGLLKDIAEYAALLRAAVDKLNPNYAIPIAVALGDEAPDLLKLPREMERLTKFAERGDVLPENSSILR